MRRELGRKIGAALSRLVPGLSTHTPPAILGAGLASGVVVLLAVLGSIRGPQPGSTR